MIEKPEQAEETEHLAGDVAEEKVRIFARPWDEAGGVIVEVPEHHATEVGGDGWIVGKPGEVQVVVVIDAVHKLTRITVVGFFARGERFFRGIMNQEKLISERNNQCQQDRRASA